MTPAPPKTIVVATDFSQPAAAAVAWAKEVALQQGAHLVVVHAANDEPTSAPEFVSVPPAWLADARDRARAHLEAAAADLRRGGLTVEWELAPGPAARGILEAADRRHTDLLVIGTRGRTAWKRLLLGSTAARVVRGAACPVLTVHPTDAGPPRPVRTVLVPTDFSEDALLAAEAATGALQPAGDRRLVLVHAFRLPIETEHLPARMLVDVIRAAADVARGRIEGVAARLARPGLQIELLTREGYPTDVILEAAKTLRPDVIAMGTHGRSGFDRLMLGSIAERILPSAPCPVLTVHREAEVATGHGANPSG